MNYKVGDKVKVKTNLKAQDHLCLHGVNEDMLKFQDKIVTIVNVFRDYYQIEEDKGYWVWDEEMFEGLAETKKESKEIKLEGNMRFEIKDYKVDETKQTVVVFFADGDTQKAKCCEGDKFDFKTGLEICIMKHICGGADKYYKVLKVADEQVEAVDKRKKEAEEKAARIARKREKRAEKKAARAERRRAERIAEMKEAYVSAIKELDSINFEKAIEVIESSVQ